MTSPPPSRPKSEPSSSRPRTTYVTCLPAGVSSVTRSPIFTSSEKPVSARMPSLPSRASVASEPCFHFSVYVCASVAGSIPTIDVVDFLPAILPSVKRTALTARRRARARTALATAGGVSPKPLFAPTVRSPANARSTARSIEPCSPAAKIDTNDDERDADHQRRRGDRRAGRVAGRVLARQPAA